VNVWKSKKELYICYVNNDKQTHNDMNNVINLKKERGFKYKYSVDGCIFTLTQMPQSKMWVMVGYASQDAYENGDWFNEWMEERKKHLLNFLKYTFERKGFSI